MAKRIQSEREQKGIHPKKLSYYQNDIHKNELKDIPKKEIKERY